MTSDLLPAWFRAVELEPGSERQQAVQQAAKSVASKATPGLPLDLVLLAHGHPREEAFDVLRKGITEHDPTFACRADDIETAIAAAACTWEMMQRKKPEIAAIAAHGVLSAAWLGLEARVANFPELAQRALETQSGRQRTRHLASVTVDLETVKDSFPKIDEDNSVTGGFAIELIDGFVSALSEVKRAVEQLGGSYRQRIDAADEELDVLWWAFSGYSEKGTLPWADIAGIGTVAMLMGLEYSELVRFPVEPSSTKAILARLLGPRADETVTIASAVDSSSSADVEWKEFERHLLLPVLSSALEFREFEGKETWRDSVDRWSIDPDLSVSALDFTEQVVREALLVRNLS